VTPAAYVFNRPLNAVDPLGLDSREKWATLFQVGYANERTAFMMAQWADQQALNSGFPGRHNGPQDAYRHCLWSCQMTKYLGERVARIIGNNHENANTRGGQPGAERDMDEHNNEAGRCAGNNSSDKRNCEDKCTGLLMCSALSWIE
jgi:hypothetical protein